MEASTKKSHSHSFNDARVKYFIKMLDVKVDKNMTRVYTAMKESEFLKSTIKNK